MSFSGVVVEHDGVGRPTRVAGAGVVVERAWRDGHLARWSMRRGSEAAVWVDYARDDAGRITDERHQDGRRVRYRYDPAGQLVAVDAGVTSWQFAWDPAGRLSREDTPAWSRDYCYDPAGQLSAVSGVRGATRFRHDACGRRIWEAGPLGTRGYRYDPLGRLVGVDTAVRGHVTRHRALAYDPTGCLADVDGLPIEEHLLVCDAGRVLEDLVNGPRTEPPGLDVWGAPEAGHDGARSRPCEVDVGHRGHICVDGLVWLGARWYDPATRSFLSPDPLPGTAGRPWASNPYSYAANDPVNHSDPTGLRPLTDTDLAALVDNWGKDGAWNRYGGYVIGGLAIAGGAALMATGVGGIAGAMLLGATFAGGVSAVSQQAQSGRVDWARVGADTLVGTALGPVVASWPVYNVGGGIVAGTAQGLVAGVARRLLEGQNPLEPDSHLSVDMGLGALAGGAIGHAIGSVAGRPTRSAPISRSPGLRPLSSVVEGVDDILRNPRVLAGRAPDEVAEIVRGTPLWRVETLRRGAHVGQGWVLREYTPEGRLTGRMIRWHPGGGQHGPEPYWRVTGRHTRSDVIR
jgi:RHS repeat-associated protein